MNDIAAVDSDLSFALARLTARAAAAAARHRGEGDERAADRAAIAAMAAAAELLPVRASIVIGEGDRSETDRLYAGEEFGPGRGPFHDLGIDPLDGATLCARGLPNALAVAVLADKGGLLATPESYMDKIAIGPGYPEGTVSLEFPPAENITRLARAKGVTADRISVCVLDRPRHGRLVEAIRAAGAQIRLIGDGDIAGVLQVLEPNKTGIDLYLGAGGAREGVLAGAALRLAGGAMEGRLILDTTAKRAKAESLGISDPHRIYAASDMAAGSVHFAATAVTDGPLLAGVKPSAEGIETHSLLLDPESPRLRRIVLPESAGA